MCNTDPVWKMEKFLCYDYRAGIRLHIAWGIYWLSVFHTFNHADFVMESFRHGSRHRSLCADIGALFLAETQIPFVDKILGLLPDQLLQVELVISHFSLYSLGGKIIGALPVLLVLYSVLCAGLLPVVYRIYRRKEVRE